MSQQSDTQLIRLISSAWRRRRTIVYSMIIVPILGLLAVMLMPKQYLMQVHITVFRSYSYNPFYTTAMQEEALNRSIKTYLGDNSFIEDAARFAGIITPEMTSAQKTKVVSDISENLYDIRAQGSHVVMWYKDSTTRNMAVLGRALSVVGTEHIRNALAKQNIIALRESVDLINKDIGVATARLAALRSRYTEQHSEVRMILGELRNLGDRREELINELKRQQDPAWFKQVGNDGAGTSTMLQQNLGQAKDLKEYEKLIYLKFFILPMFPYTILNLILSLIVISLILLILGIASGIGMAAILEGIDSRIRQREILEAITGKPVLGRIPALVQTNSTKSAS